MRVLSLALCLGALPVFAQAPTQHEREFAMSHLHASRKLFLDALEGLSEAQWRFKPAAERWSIAEIAEHITATEDLLFGFVGKVMQGTEEPARGGEEADEKLMNMLRDRSQRATAPAEARPTGRWKSRAELTEAFKKGRDRTISYIETTQDSLRRHFGPEMAGTRMDAYQYLLLVAGHTERHVAQIQEVKANPNYPK